MAGVWNIGNTTVRNPKRIEMGLRLIYEAGLLGNLEGEENEIKLTELLVNSGAVDSESTGASSAWLGRKWRNVMVKLGFITDKFYKIDGERVATKDIASEVGVNPDAYSLTPAGRKLVEAKTAGEIQDIFLQQLYRHRIPNPIEKKASKDPSPMSPFVLLLDVILNLDDEDSGINQMEIALFLQEVRKHENTSGSKIAKDVRLYRERRGKLSSKREKLQYDRDILLEISKRTKLKLGTPLDYADTTIRYASMSGLFEMRGSRLCIREEKKNIARELVSALRLDSGSLEYLKEFYSGAGLHTDYPAALNDELEVLQKKAHILNIDLGAKEQKEPRARKYQLEEEILLAKEEQFALAQQGGDQIDEIITSLSKLSANDRAFQKSILDLPAFLEWVVWRSFLSIDHIAVPVKETRGFPVDSDLQPRYPAPGGKPDMSFEFSDYKLVVEVTFTTSVRQYIAECEPVRRHVANASGTKGSLGIFIAPTLDNNFLHGVRDYIKETELVKLKILPLTLSNFTKLMEIHKASPLTPEDIKDLILKVNDDNSANGLEWKKHIEETFGMWVHERDRLILVDT